MSLVLRLTSRNNFSTTAENIPGVHLDLESKNGGHPHLPGGFSEAELMKAAREGVQGAALQGPLLGFPVMHFDVSISDINFDSSTNLAMISSYITEGVAKALQRAEVQLLEPCGELVVVVSEEHLGRVLADLTSHRRARVREVGVQGEDSMERVVTSITPLANLMGYSTVLRTITSGTGTFSSNFSHYEPVSRDQEKTIIQTLRGYTY